MFTKTGMSYHNARKNLSLVSPFPYEGLFPPIRSPICFFWGQENLKFPCPLSLTSVLTYERLLMHVLKRKEGDNQTGEFLKPENIIWGKMILAHMLGWLLLTWFALLCRGFFSSSFWLLSFIQMLTGRPVFVPRLEMQTILALWNGLSWVDC